MGRLVMMIGLAALFAGWVLFRLVIKRDLLQHRAALGLGAFFLGIWGMAFWWLLA